MVQVSVCSHLSPSDDHFLMSGKTCFSNPCKYMPMVWMDRLIVVCILLLSCAIFLHFAGKTTVGYQPFEIPFHFNDVFSNWHSHIENAKCGRAQRTLGSCLISVHEGITLLIVHFKANQLHVRVYLAVLWQYARPLKIELCNVQKIDL